MANAYMPVHRTQFLKAFGAELRGYRKAAKMSQSEVASWMDWNRDAVSKIENGENNMSVYDYMKLLNFLAAIVEDDHPGLVLAGRFVTWPGAGA